MDNRFSLVPLDQTATRQYDLSCSPSASNEYSTTPLRIRETQLADLPSVAALLAKSFYPPSSWMGWLAPLLQIGIQQELHSQLNSTSANSVCLIAIQGVPKNCTNGSVTGTVEVGLRSLSPWQLSLSKYPYISNLAVKPAYRRQGVAQQLLLACEQIVLEWGFQDLYLHVLENNQPAQRLYAKVGYQMQQTDWVWPQLLFGQPRRLLLHKCL